jgi:ABC-type glycerol-3-phosphate transport system substrate-binding protein
MQTIDFSKMLLNRSAANEAAFFDSFEQHQQIRAKRHQVGWPEAWNRLLQFGLNPQGPCPDLSEIGTTWLGSFHTMEALHPFVGQEIAKIGSAKQFLPEAWQACVVEPEQLVVGIPWTLDIRIVLYRRDWLQKAGIEETTAFSDAEHFRQTLRGLQDTGHLAPLGLTTRQTVTRMLHDLACWVWDARGEIRSHDGQKMLLAQSESLSGLEAYFGLNEFLDPEMQGQEEPDVLRSFMTGKTAVAVVSDLNYYWLKMSETSEVTENLGVARLMKVPFLGGTALAIWRYSTHVDAALKLIEYLTSIEAGQVLYEQYLTTPANLEAIAQSTLAQDPFYPIIRKSLLTGRSFHSGYRWAGVEARLIPVIEKFWQDLRANPKLEIACEVEKRFTELCIRLEQTILSAYQ